MNALLTHVHGTAFAAPVVSLCAHLSVSQYSDSLAFRQRMKCTIRSDADFEISGVLHDGLAYCMVGAAQPSPANLVTCFSPNVCEECMLF